MDEGMAISAGMYPGMSASPAPAPPPPPPAAPAPEPANPDAGLVETGWNGRTDATDNSSKTVANPQPTPQAAAAAPYPAVGPTGATVTVQPGNTLSELAAAGGVSVTQLLAANPQITNPDLIRVGQTINLPGKAALAPVPAATPAAPVAPTPAPVAVAPTPVAATPATSTAATASDAAWAAADAGSLGVTPDRTWEAADAGSLGINVPSAPAPASPVPAPASPARQAVIDAVAGVDDAKQVRFNSFERDQAVLDARAVVTDKVIDYALQETANSIGPNNQRLLGEAISDAPAGVAPQLPKNANDADLLIERNTASIVQSVIGSSDQRLAKTATERASQLAHQASDSLASNPADQSGSAVATAPNSAVNFANAWNQQTQNADFSIERIQSLSVINATFVDEAAKRIATTAGPDFVTPFWTNTSEALERSQKHEFGDALGEKALALAAPASSRLLERFADPESGFNSPGGIDDFRSSLVDHVSDGNGALLKASINEMQSRLPASQVPALSDAQQATSRTLTEVKSIAADSIDLAREKLVDTITDAPQAVRHFNDMIVNHGAWNPERIPDAVGNFLATDKGQKFQGDYEKYLLDVDQRAANMYHLGWDMSFGSGTAAPAGVADRLDEALRDPVVGSAIDSSITVQADSARFKQSVLKGLESGVMAGDPQAKASADQFAQMGGEVFKGVSDPNASAAASDKGFPLANRTEQRWALVGLGVLTRSTQELLSGGNGAPQLWFGASTALGKGLRMPRSVHFGVDAVVQGERALQADNLPARFESGLRTVGQSMNTVDDLLGILQRSNGTGTLTSGSPRWVSPVARGLGTVATGIQTVRDYVDWQNGERRGKNGGDVALDLAELSGGAMWTAGGTMQGLAARAAASGAAGATGVSMSGAALTGIGAIVIGSVTIGRIQYERVKASNANETPEDTRFIQDVTGLDQQQARELSNRSSSGASAEPVLQDFLWRDRGLTRSQSVDYLKQLSPQQIKDLVAVSHGVEQDRALRRNVDTHEYDALYRAILENPDRYQPIAADGNYVDRYEQMRTPRSNAALNDFLRAHGYPDASPPPVMTSSLWPVDPPPEAIPQSAPASATNVPAVTPAPVPSLYQVQPGDNLWDLSHGALENLTPEELYELNRQFDTMRSNGDFFSPEATDERRDPDLIHPGEWIKVGEA